MMSEIAEKEYMFEERMEKIVEEYLKEHKNYFSDYCKVVDEFFKDDKKLKDSGNSKN